MMMIMTMMMMMVMMMTVMMMMMTTKNAIEYGDGIVDTMQREYDACRCRRTGREAERESGTDGTHRGTRNTEDEQLAR